MPLVHSWSSWTVFCSERLCDTARFCGRQCTQISSLQSSTATISNSPSLHVNCAQQFTLNMHFLGKVEKYSKVKIDAHLNEIRIFNRTFARGVIKLYSLLYYASILIVNYTYKCIFLYKFHDVFSREIFGRFLFNNQLSLSKLVQFISSKIWFFCV